MGRHYAAQIRICGGPGWATTQVYPAREATLNDCVACVRAGTVRFVVGEAAVAVQCRTGIGGAKSVAKERMGKAMSIIKSWKSGRERIALKSESVRHWARFE
jgi:hypothetical protein